MTEDEAKTLASELTHHKMWRVIRVWEYSPMRWAIELQHRHKPDGYGAIYGLPPVDILRAALDGTDHPALYPNTPPTP